MTDATYIPRAFAQPTTKRETPKARPKPRPYSAPVFIHDCVTPLGGETVLSLLMKRFAKDAEL